MRGLETLLLHCHPAEAELALTWLPDEVDPERARDLAELELRGRLTGPRQPFRETIQVAYPVRPLPPSGDVVRARVVIPDPLMWTPEEPYLYSGPIEVWQAGQLVRAADVAVGLRTVALHLRKGLRVNGSVATLPGLVAPRGDAESARRPRADRLGFFVLGETDPEDEPMMWHAAEDLGRHASCLGWVLPQALVPQPQRWHQAVSLLQASRPGQFIGLRVAELPLGVAPGHVSFLVGDAEVLDQLPAEGLPQWPILPRGESSWPTPEGLLRLGTIQRRLEG